MFVAIKADQCSLLEELRLLRQQMAKEQKEAATPTPTDYKATPPPTDTQATPSAAPREETPRTPPPPPRRSVPPKRRTIDYPDGPVEMVWVMKQKERIHRAKRRRLRVNKQIDDYRDRKEKELEEEELDDALCNNLDDYAYSRGY